MAEKELSELTFLEWLSLPEDAPYEEVDRKFKRLVKTLHEDKGGDVQLTTYLGYILSARSTYLKERHEAANQHGSMDLAAILNAAMTENQARRAELEKSLEALLGGGFAPSAAPTRPASNKLLAELARLTRKGTETPDNG
jgi:tRNA U34 5-methylaminomethyl-2-thiouridine-forming methyltransferase MnmC